MIPYNTDAPLYHMPIATVGLIVLNTVLFLAVPRAMVGFRKATYCRVYQHARRHRHRGRCCKRPSAFARRTSFDPCNIATGLECVGFGYYVVIGVWAGHQAMAVADEYLHASRSISSAVQHDRAVGVRFSRRGQSWVATLFGDLSWHWCGPKRDRATADVHVRRRRFAGRECGDLWNPRCGDRFGLRATSSRFFMHLAFGWGPPRFLS